MTAAESFPVVFGICLDAEAIWLGINAENARRPAQLSHGAYEIREGLTPEADAALVDRAISGLSAALAPRRAA